MHGKIAVYDSICCPRPRNGIDEYAALSKTLHALANGLMLVFQHPAKRPGVVIYLNGIALELKRSTVTLAEWTRQVDELNAARAKANKVPA